jgi:ribulose-phosphate 3-epimerase
MAFLPELEEHPTPASTVAIAMTASSPPIAIAASLICADLCNIERELQRMESAGIDLLHVDLIDAHFSPSMPMGLEVVQQARKKTALPFDVHLMVRDNEFFIGEMLKIGVRRISFHPESAFHVDRCLSLIRDAGVQAGLALMPATPLDVLEYCLERLDFVLLMLINPGFAGHVGETQVPYALRKVADCRRFLYERGLNLPIEVDGRVSFDNIPGLIAAGATDLVAGSRSAFHRDADLASNLKRMRQIIAQSDPSSPKASGG